MRGRGVFSFNPCHSREGGNPESVCRLYRMPLDARLRGHDRKNSPTVQLICQRVRPGLSGHSLSSQNGHLISVL